MFGEGLDGKGHIMTSVTLGGMHSSCGSAGRFLPLVTPQNENPLKYSLKDHVQRTVLKTGRTRTLLSFIQTRAQYWKYEPQSSEGEGGVLERDQRMEASAGEQQQGRRDSAPEWRREARRAGSRDPLH